MTIADAVQAASLGVKQPIAADAVVGQQAEYYLSSDTSVGYTQGLSQHLNLSMGYGYQRSDSKSGTRNFESQSVRRSAQLQPRARACRSGPATATATTEYPLANGTVDRFGGSSIDGGVDYNKALSFSRRTTLGVPDRNGRGV